ncbi:MAG: type II toxin-antitoxin system RelB/DinJ family antitoxin [Candidatus Paceibacterota bacterium]
MNTTLQLRLNKETKTAAKKIFAEMGLDMSSGVKIFLSQVVRTGSIPFEVRTANGFTPAQEKEMLQEAKKIRKGHGFKTAKELHEAILK